MNYAIIRCDGLLSVLELAVIPKVVADLNMPGVENSLEYVRSVNDDEILKFETEELACDFMFEHFPITLIDPKYIKFVSYNKRYHVK